MYIRKKLISLSFLMAMFNAAPVLASQYIYNDLGTLGGNHSYANGINNRGQVVGWASTADDIFYQAFLYDVSMKNLQNLSVGATNSYANSINDIGQIVGNVWLKGGGSTPFIYNNGNVKNLDTLGGGNSYVIYSGGSINNNGQVVGVSGTPWYPPYNSADHAFLYDGNMLDLGTLGGTHSYAYAINNNGLVVGSSSDSNDYYFHAFVYDGSMKDLGTLGGVYSYANDINDNGLVVGKAHTLDNYFHAFLYENNLMQDLGTLGGDISVANALNNSGQIVGDSSIKNSFIDHAFLYENGTMKDLNTFLDDSLLSAGWILSSANSINDKGWIVGTATNSITGFKRAYLLSTEISAVPESESYVLFLTGLGMLGWVSSKRKKQQLYI